MEILRGTIFSDDPNLREQLEDVLGKIRAFSLVRHTISGFPTEERLATFLEVQAPAIVFIDISDIERGIQLGNLINKLSRNVQLVAVAPKDDPQLLLTAMRAGMREYLALPLSINEVVAALSRLKELLQANPPSAEYNQNVYSFLPAKPGSGASTACINLGFALTKSPESRAALLDFDMHCGVLDFLLKLPQGFSVRDAAEHAAHMDEAIWMRMVTQVGRVDVLRAGRPREYDSQLPNDFASELVSFARRQYQTVCLDLSGHFDKISVDVLQHSNKIFLVTTPELAALYAARRSMEILQSLHLKDRVGILLNRANSQKINQAQVEELLGTGIYAAIPNDYQAVQDSLTAGHCMAPSTSAGRRYHEIADNLTGRKPSSQQKKKSIFGVFEKLTMKAATVN